MADFSTAGTAFKEGDGQAQEQFTAIATVISVEPPKMTREAVSNTRINATTKSKTDGNMVEWSECKVTLAYDETTTPAILTAGMGANAAKNYQIVYSNGETWQFKGFIIGWEMPKIDPESPTLLSVDVSYQVSEAVTFA